MRKDHGGRWVRVLAAGAVIAVALATLVSPTAASPRAPETTSRFQAGVPEEQAFVDKINQLRSSLALAPLTIDPELTAQARIWAQTMKDAGNIFHTKTLDAGITANWQKLGENVGVGGTVDALFDAFVASPKHYENLVDPSYRFVGVGVVWDGSRMFTAHRFMALMPPAPATPPTSAPPPARTAPTNRTKSTTPGAGASTATTQPDQLASTEPSTTTTEAPPAAPVPPAPIVPPARPGRIALVLATVDDLAS